MNQRIRWYDVDVGVWIALAARKASKGRVVWQDTSEIRAGRSWEKQIEDGLRSTQLVIALLSPHAVRKSTDRNRTDNLDSVCLDEISFARFARPPIPIVPAMAAQCDPPFCIFRLDYVDLTSWNQSEDRYRAGFQDLLQGIEEGREGKVQYRTWVHRLKPLDVFDVYLNEKRQDFCGRQWLFDEIDAWRFSSRERALLITGDPGVGKSAIVAELVHQNPEGQLLAYHCCMADTPETLRPARFVQSLTPDGNTAVSSSRDKTLSVWDVATGKLVAMHSLEAIGSAVAVASDNRIVAGTGSGQLHFLTLQNWLR